MMSQLKNVLIILRSLDLLTSCFIDRGYADLHLDYSVRCTEISPELYCHNFEQKLLSAPCICVKKGQSYPFAHK